ncbi:sensor histidine kinase [Zhihengliuella halotolerans]|uniref:Two-component system LytT family sensor kinase n=1 Tax=Zhihengliuella halotolerans TaxID=370736 RepID=A0A4V6MGF5_9MICC|nr:histidine kinase [Zhihengliuella halotolerans]RZU61946.1 two-component system LytT family sensor kinase [Zhihengliuella halotolerans]
MMSPALETTLIVSIIVAAAAVVVYVGMRVFHAQRDLGTDADRATFQTLHTVSLAAPHLANGLEEEGASRASRHLRELLGCRGLAVTNTTAVLAADGALPDVDVLALASQTITAGRTQVVHGRDWDAVCSPVVVQDRTMGTVIAFAAKADSGLVRAGSEVAAWVAAHVGLAELDESRARLAEAEVKALRAQISPHFIYNSLGAIASFINTDPERARELVVEFADFTRYTFRRHGEFTTLAEELQAIDRYLLLEKARFGDRIRVSLEIAPEVLGTVIPFLSLQPLVENAVRHGLEGRPDGGLITITAADDGQHAVITIEDDGVGMDPEHLRDLLGVRPDGEHVGLRNVDVRLRQLYGPEHGLVVDTAPGAGTLITVRLPKFRTPRLEP